MLKTVHVDGIGEVVIARRKGTKHIRISLPKNGTVRLSIPNNVSERAGIDFLSKKADWISKNRNTSAMLKDGMRVGKSHYLKFIPSQTKVSRSSISDNELRVFVPFGMSIQDKKIQTTANKVVKRALQKQANKLLPDRLSVLAKKFDVSYNSVACKPLKSRWGSCSNKNDIILNIYLLQLEWDLIDYVIIHELVHTIHHNHSKDFWTQVESFMPRFKENRKLLKSVNSGLNV